MIESLNWKGNWNFPAFWFPFQAASLNIFKQHRGGNSRTPGNLIFERVSWDIFAWFGSGVSELSWRSSFNEVGNKSIRHTRCWHEFWSSFGELNSQEYFNSDLEITVPRGAFFCLVISNYKGQRFKLVRRECWFEIRWFV